MDQGVVLVVGVVVSVVIYVIASLRVARGDRRWMPLTLVPRFIGPVLLLAVGIRYLLEKPLIGVFMTVFGGILLLVYVRAAVQVARASRTSRTEEEYQTAAINAFTEPLIVWGALLLLGGFLTIVGLLVWAALGGGR